MLQSTSSSSSSYEADWGNRWRIIWGHHDNDDNRKNRNKNNNNNKRKNKNKNDQNSSNNKHWDREALRRVRRILLEEDHHQPTGCATSKRTTGLGLGRRQT